MKCLVCGRKLRLRNKSWERQTSNSIIRYRECVDCLTTYRTTEVIDLEHLDPYIKHKLLKEDETKPPTE